ncbi:MAG: hypothetical protein Q9192_002513 [Flavoplaca navasiana]
MMLQMLLVARQVIWSPQSHLHLPAAQSQIDAPANTSLLRQHTDTHLRPHGLENEPLNDSQPKSRNNPKKRPSTSDLLDHPDHAQSAVIDSKEINGADTHPQKRSRAAEWPLRSTDDDSSSSIITHRPPNKSPISPAQRRNLVRLSRPSAFLEGSMNDRVSKKPPSIYLRDEAAMEHYHNPTSTPEPDSRNTLAMHDDKVYYDAGIETAKPSGMYRFGKALASAFNPVSVWHGINGYWKVKDEPKQADKDILQERKVKAERTYAEMKKNGFKGTQPFAFRGSSIDGSGCSDGTTHRYSTESSLRDSGIDFGDQHTMTASKNKQPTPAGSEDMLIASTLLRSRRALSPLAKEETGRKTSLNLSRPSLQGLRKAKSHFNLSASKQKVADAATPLPVQGPSFDKQRLTRQPSKKNIAKQRKLSKQVSDLESKLQTARHELELSRGEIPDVPKIPKNGRKPFKPGALPSSSESFLNSTEESFGAENDSKPKSSKSRKPPGPIAIPRKSAIKHATARVTPPKGKKRVKGQASAPTSSGKKRRVSAGLATDRSYEAGQCTDDGSDTNRGTSLKKASLARQSCEVGAGNKGSEPGHSSVGAFKGTRQSLSRNRATVPPVPALQFDAAKVDKKKLLAMRSVPKDTLPFGSHLDDIVNLQKEYPHVSQKLLDQYLSSLSKNGKPVLDPASPTKAGKVEETWERASPGHVKSSPSRSGVQNLCTIDEAIIMDPSTDKSIPPLPRSPMKATSNPTLSRPSRGRRDTDKPLPAIQKEDFEWPEDVF